MLHWLRIALAVHALLVNIVRFRDVAHQGMLVAACLVMVIWTALCGFAYSKLTAPRLKWWVVADVVVNAALVVSSAYVLGPIYHRDFLTITVYWAVCAAISVAMLRNLWLGMGVGLLFGLLKVAVAPGWQPALWAETVVMSLTAAGAGLLVDLLLSSSEDRDRAFATSAALAERERLNRIVHDGVLQVLALTEREGPGLGPRGVRLAALAREQEMRLRALLQDRSMPDSPDASYKDLASVLDRHATSSVTISTMADEVRVSTQLADEIDAVVTEILTNVAKHAGPGARAWLLLEHEDDDVVISIRDNGVGASQEHLMAAGENGHVGVQNSIIGRVRDLGGQALLTALPGRGVEWELRIPVQ